MGAPGRIAVLRGHAQLAEYWQRVKLQKDVHVSFEVLKAEFAHGVCQECRIWWHSMPLA